MAKKRQESEKQGVLHTVAPTTESGFPADSGAYALLIRLERPFSGQIGALGPVELPAGDYVYCGSAKGPGGLRARLNRHLRAEKRSHWHVDALTAHGTVSAVLAVPGGSECGLVGRARRIPGVTIPYPGFGSSDCRRCESHLLSIDGDGKAVLGLLEQQTGA